MIRLFLFIKPLPMGREQRENVMKIEMRRIDEIDGFTKAEFCVNPRYWGYKMQYGYQLPKEVIDEITVAASKVDGICFAEITDDFGTFVVGSSCNKGMSNSFWLYNAQRCSRISAEVRAITYNTGRGALTDFWTDQWLHYAKNQKWSA